MKSHRTIKVKHILLIFMHRNVTFEWNYLNYLQ